MVIIPDLLWFLKNGITEPLELITFPYLTTEKLIFFLLFVKLEAIINLSEHNFEAPYKLIGATALSVDRATTFLTCEFKQASTKF